VEGSTVKGVENKPGKNTGLIHDIHEMMKNPERRFWFIMLFPISALPFIVVIAFAVIILQALGTLSHSPQANFKLKHYPKSE